MSSASQRFAFRLTIAVPKVAGGHAPDGGLPEKLEFESQLEEQTARLVGAGGALAIRPGRAEYREAMGIPPHLDLLQLVYETDAVDFDAAFRQAGDVVDRVLDDLMFQLQCPVQVGQLDVRDVTPPMTVGEDRSLWVFSSYPFDRYARSVALGTMVVDRPARLRESYAELDSGARAALRWYTKSLETPFTHDAFMFLWIALESIVNRSGLSVEMPYVNPRCQHAIPNCPICNASTERKVQGATLKRFLVESGVSSEDADAIWKLRQMMHGAIGFESSKLERLGELVQVLRAAVAGLLKDAQGIAGASNPVVGFGGVAIHPAMGVSGHGPVTADELEDLIT